MAVSAGPEEKRRAWRGLDWLMSLCRLRRLVKHAAASDTCQRRRASAQRPVKVLETLDRTSSSLTGSSHIYWTGLRPFVSVAPMEFGSREREGMAGPVWCATESSQVPSVGAAARSELLSGPAGGDARAAPIERPIGHVPSRTDSSSLLVPLHHERHHRRRASDGPEPASRTKPRLAFCACVPACCLWPAHFPARSSSAPSSFPCCFPHCPLHILLALSRKSSSSLPSHPIIYIDSQQVIPISSPPITTRLQLFQFFPYKP